MRPITVGDMIIHDEYVKIGAGSTVHFAIRRMAEHPHSIVVVVDDEDRPLGVVCSKHIFRAIDKGIDIDRTKVRELMSRNIVLVNEHDLLLEVVENIRSMDTPKDAILVVDNNGRLKGYFSLSDYRYALKLLETLTSDDIELMKRMKALAHMKSIHEEL